MPITFSVSEEFDEPPERVFAALTDLENAAEWLPKLVSIERTEAGPLAAGHSWRETRKMYGRNASEHIEVTEFAPPSLLALRIDGTRGSTGRGEFRFRYHVLPNGSGTHVTLDAEIDGLGRVMTTLGRLFVGAYKKAIAEDLVALRGHLAAAVSEAPEDTN